MKLPFFYPEHPEFKKRVEYVAKELRTFSEDAQKPWTYDTWLKEAEARAKDIVLEVCSKPASRWPSKDFHIGYIVGAVVGGALATWLALTI